MVGNFFEIGVIRRCVAKLLLLLITSADGVDDNNENHYFAI